jgi:putative redox protein
VKSALRCVDLPVIDSQHVTRTDAWLTRFGVRHSPDPGDGCRPRGRRDGPSRQTSVVVVGLVCVLHAKRWRAVSKRRLSVAFEVEVRNLDGLVTALGMAEHHTVVVDRPKEAGGGGHGFNGGELLHLAVAGCVSNDLFREAAARGLNLRRVVVRAAGDFGGEPVTSSGISYSVELAGGSSAEDLEALARYVDSIAEIPNSLRSGTAVELSSVTVSEDG